MNLNEIVKSKYFKWTLIIIGELILLLVIFNAGMFIGFKKANFSYQWGENYHKNFGGPREGFMPGPMPIPGKGPGPDFMGEDFVNPHGTTGVILSISTSTPPSAYQATSTPAQTAPSLIIRGNDNTEKTVIIGADTIIRRNRDTITVNNLAGGEMVVVIGEPNNSGQIEAKFIRVFENN